MSANARPGRLGGFKVGNGTPDIPVGGIRDQSINFNVDELETTDHDSNGHREYIPNHDDATIDLELIFIQGDAGQEILLQSIDNKTSFDFEYTMQRGVSGAVKWVGKAFATSASPSAPLDDIGAMSVTLRGSGVTRGGQ